MIDNKVWNVNVINDNPVYPFVVIDNWYTQGEESAVWTELDFYSSLPKINIPRAENTIVSRLEDGTPLGKHYRWYTSSIYNDYGRQFSPILNCMYKQRTPEFHNLLKGCQPHYKSFNSTNRDSTLVSYYEENDHYKPHWDNAHWTMCIWFFKDPKKFTGGDFTFDEPNIEVKCKHNRAVFFPSCYSHSVSPIKFDKKPIEFGTGRYTITHFYYTDIEQKYPEEVKKGDN